MDKQSSGIRVGLLAVVISLVTTLGAATGACAGPVPPQDTSQVMGAEEATVSQKLQKLTITPSKATVGTEVQAQAQGLPPGKLVDIIWRSVSGGWVIEDYYHFRGKRFAEKEVTLARATVGPDGGFLAGFQIPEDYGGVHEVAVYLDGAVLAQGGIEVTQTFEMSPLEGPVGTPIELRVTGLGWRTMESTWVVNWDNHLAGWVSAVDTNGTAVARFRATGPVGDHQVKVYTGYQAQAYLNYEQAPTAYLPRPEFVFRTTPGAAATATYAEPYPLQPVPPGSNSTGNIRLWPSQGPVLSTARLSASGLPAGAVLDLIWGTWVGSRVTETGFAPREKALGTVQVNQDGGLEAEITIPDDLGGLHTLALRHAGKDLARAYFAIETSIVDISPRSGPTGTPVTIHLKGVGWTEYDNIYVATYDNAYMGYACGFNSQGDVVVNFTATGVPGLHLIDLYPGLYQGPEKGQQLYRLPQLTYADDHPGNKIPALRFAFEVTR